MSADEEGSRDRLEIDWLRAVAGALAAVASAVLLSAFGELGTLLGAALGSLVLTIGSALFAQGIRSSGRTLAKAQTSAKQKVGIAKAEVIQAGRTDDSQVQDDHLDHAEDQLAEADQELEEAQLAAAPTPWRQRLARLRWRRVLLVSLVLFVAAMAFITVFELIAGRSVASYTGGSDSDSGTTIGQVTHGGGKQSPSPEPSESPTPAAPTTVVPPPVGSQTPTPSASPSASPSESVSPSVAPSEAPAPASSSTP